MGLYYYEHADGYGTALPKGHVELAGAQLSMDTDTQVLTVSTADRDICLKADGPDDDLARDWLGPLTQVQSLLQVLLPTEHSVGIEDAEELAQIAALASTERGAESPSSRSDGEEDEDEDEEDRLLQQELMAIVEAAEPEPAPTPSRGLGALAKMKAAAQHARASMTADALVSLPEESSKIWQKGYLWKQSGGAKTADGRTKRSLGSTRRKWDRRWFVLVEGVRPLGSRVKTAVVCV